jgi:transposase
LRHWRIQAREEEIIHSLHRNWKQDVLFELQQAVDAYDFYRKQIAQCDSQLKQYMVALPTREALPTTPTASEPVAATDTGKKRRPRKPKGNQPDFALAEELERILGVNATLIDGIDGMTIQTVLAEVGPDLSAWKTEAQWSSWLNLAPKRDISGGKVIPHRREYRTNRVGNAFRMAAQSLVRRESYLGARYRYLRAKLGGLKAVKAMARVLACLYYRLVTKGQVWVDRGTAEFEQRRQQRDLATLQRKARSLGLQLVPAA